jgi:choline dehydrogenase
MIFDVVIVGAGSAGCALAARLSEEPGRSVLLIEAGPDYRTEAELPTDVHSGLNPTFSHDWGFASEPGAIGRSIAMARARLVGGCSATNATFALRGAPADYDDWAARGLPGWSFADVLPFFRKLEDDHDFDDGWHGRGGPLPIRRYAVQDLVPEQAAFLSACSELGYPAVSDHNAPGAIGAGRLPTSSIGGVRQSTALTYLAAARHRSNLAIRGAVVVDRVVFDGRRAIGIRLAQAGETIRAHHVVLAAGAFGSPAILLRSGIGPASHLRSLGIEVLLDLPGVGQRLADHPRVGLRFATPPPPDAHERPGCQVLLTLSSSPALPGHDLHIFPWTSYAADEKDSPSGGAMTIHVAVVKPRSLGQLRLRSIDPGASPLIDVGFFTHPDDMPRMVSAIRIARSLARAAPLTRTILGELSPGFGTGDGEKDIEATIRAEVGTYYHPVGTCAAGPRSSPLAVVDSRARVHGVEGLSVVDASIMPSIPAANTNVPTIMLAERCAVWLDAWLQQRSVAASVAGA